MRHFYCFAGRRARLLRAVASGVLAAALNASAFAAAPKEKNDPLATDSRLTQHVIVSSEGIALGDLMQRLSRQAKVPLAAASEVADDKIIIFTPARSLREILADIAALFNGRWERHPRSGRLRQYLLTRDLRARELDDRLARQRVQRLRDRLDEYVGALSEAPEVLALRPKEDAIRLCLSRPDSRLGLAFYALLSGAQRERLFTRRRLEFAFRSLSPDQQEPLRRVFSDLLDQSRSGDTGASSGSPTRLRTLADLEEGTIQFQWRELLGQTNLQFQLGRSPILVEAFFASSTWLVPLNGNPYTGDPVSETALLPALQLFEIASVQRTWPDSLRELARSAKIPVVADYYRSRPIARTIQGVRSSSASPRAALDALCGVYGYAWWMRGKTLLLRKRDWFAQRLKEVPDRWIVAMAERLHAQQACPTRGDVLRLLDLSLPQIAALIDKVTVEDEMELQGLRELLAIISASPKGQTVPVPVGDARGSDRTVLDTEQMTIRQRQLLPAFFAAAGDSLANGSDDGLLIQMWRTQEEPQSTQSGYRYVRVLVSGNARTYSLYLPLVLPDDRRDSTKIEVQPGNTP
jgi:hypothetical protein